MLWEFIHSQVPDTAQELEKILLANRHIHDAHSFFSPVHPRDLTLEDVGIDAHAMAKAVARIKHAIANQEKVLIYGDYDADGISATAILWQSLRSAGLVAVPFIPRRDKHGYGISVRAIDEIMQAGAPSLIITVDNGIVAFEAIAYAQSHGIDVILSDHHQPEADVNSKTNYPQATAVVHTTQLCGATVSWMLSRELSPETVEPHLDLAALATIADQVPLTGANRSFALHGLSALRRTKRVGLKALSELCNVDLADLTSTAVGYTLAPRINAMGRLAHGLDALRLLCTSSWHTARKQARLLSETNSNRQELTHDQMQIAIEQVTVQSQESVLFVASDKFHEGVIGLIAGRLVEQFAKPALVVAINGLTAKGSARSVAGVDIVAVLREVRDDLLEVGGHPMAAGFGVRIDKLEVVKTRLFTLAKTAIHKELLIPKLLVDCRLPCQLVSLETCALIEKCSPFGAGNPEPVFVLEKFVVKDSKPLGKNHRHLKLWVSDAEESTNICEAVFWNQGSLLHTLKKGTKVSLLTKLECNEWNSKKKVQLVIKDIQVG